MLFLTVHTPSLCGMLKLPMKNTIKNCDFCRMMRKIVESPLKIRARGKTSIFVTSIDISCVDNCYHVSETGSE